MISDNTKEAIFASMVEKIIGKTQSKIAIIIDKILNIIRDFWFLMEIIDITIINIHKIATMESKTNLVVRSI